MSLPTSHRGGPMITTRTVADILDMPEPNWLVDRFLEQEGVTLIVGPPGSFKSFLALEIAMSVASGREFLFHSSRQPSRSAFINQATEVGLADPIDNMVTYIHAEGGGFLQWRVEAWLRYYASNSGDFGDALQFVLEPVQLWERQIGKNPQIPDLIEAASGSTVVIVDTLARATAGLNENAAEDMGAFIGVIDRIRAHGKGVIIIHHTTKDEATYRGSSALEGAADTIIKVSTAAVPGRVDEVSIKLQWKKQKNAQQPPPLLLEPVPVMFGRTLPSGDEAGSIVLQPVPDSDSMFETVTSDLTPRQQDLLIEIATRSEKPGVVDADGWFNQADINAYKLTANFNKLKKTYIKLGYLEERQHKGKPQLRVTDAGAKKVTYLSE